MEMELEHSTCVRSVKDFPGHAGRAAPIFVCSNDAFGCFSGPAIAIASE